MAGMITDLMNLGSKTAVTAFGDAGQTKTGYIPNAQAADVVRDLLSRGYAFRLLRPGSFDYDDTSYANDIEVMVRWLDKLGVSEDAPIIWEQTGELHTRTLREQAAVSA